MAISRENLVSDFKRVRGTLPGAATDWLAALRESAITSFDSLGFPSVRDENWRYTNVAPLLALDPAPRARIEVPDEASLSRFFLGCRSHRIVFLDGVLVPELSRLTALPRGLRLAGIAELVERGEAEALKDQLTASLLHESHAFAALNTAFHRDGALVSVEPGVTIDAPIELVFVASGKSALCFPRVVVSIGAGASVRLAETYVSLGNGDSLTDVVTEIRVGEGARLEHQRLQAESTDAFHLGMTTIEIAEKAEVFSHRFSIGSRIGRDEVVARFTGECAGLLLNGTYVGKGTQLLDHPTVIEHLHPACRSEETYKGVLTDRARGVFSGRVLVAPGAAKTDAKQDNRNLLLSVDAEVDTRPQLEIYADDVKCSHGATVGQLDDASIFYLRSRGIGEAQARRMLTEAFVGEAIASIADADMRRLAEGFTQGAMKELW